MAIFDVLCHGTEKIINKIIKTYETANELKQKIVSLDKDAKNFKKDNFTKNAIFAGHCSVEGGLRRGQADVPHQGSIVCAD